MRNKTMGLYCGSFAPLHNGHIGIIKEVLKEKLVDKLIVVPTSDYKYKKVVMDFDLRLKSLKTIESEDIIIDSDIDDSEAPNTYTLLERLKDKYPDYKFKLILGADLLSRINIWVKSDYLLNNYEFIVMKREGYDINKLMNNLNKKDYSILKCDNFNVSSTFIRDNLDNPELIKDLIPLEILEIIKS